MKYKLLVYAFVLWAGVAFGEEGTLVGVVVGPEGEVIPGANIALVGDLFPSGKGRHGHRRKGSLPLGAAADRRISTQRHAYRLSVPNARRRWHRRW